MQLPLVLFEHTMSYSVSGTELSPAPEAGQLNWNPFIRPHAAVGRKHDRQTNPSVSMTCGWA
jgi:hypothetical protein